MRRKIVLYGAGMEGEKFYWKHRDEFEIEYCIDRKNNRTFHGSNVYGFDEVKRDLKGHFVVIAAVKEAYEGIEKALKEIGLQEFEDYLGAFLVGRELAIIYGNCHMAPLEEYLGNNFWFNKMYVTRRYYVGVSEIPADLELAHCGLLIGQDIRAENECGVPSMEELIKKTGRNCRSVVIPNLYRYNLYFPQLESNINYVNKHLNKNAINVDLYSDKDAGIIRDKVQRLGYGEKNIERLYREGKSCEDIVSYITEGDVYEPEKIRKNFDEQLQRIKEREKACDIQVSDYIEENYKEHLLFYNPWHPTERMICEKGKRILQFLNIPIDEDVPVIHRVDWMEMFVYGCVKRALGMRFKQNYIRRWNTENTLSNRPVDLKEYVSDYIAWVCEEE